MKPLIAPPAAWSPYKVGGIGLLIAAGMACALGKGTRWPELPVPAPRDTLRTGFAIHHGQTPGWGSAVPDPTRFARPDSAGFSTAAARHRPGSTYQVAEYQPPVSWLDVGSSGQRIGPVPSVAPPAPPARLETAVEIPEETQPERLRTTAPIVVIRGALEQRGRGNPAAIPAPVVLPSGSTITGPTVVELAAGDSGTVVFFRLARSSGDTGADDAGLAFVRALQFTAVDPDETPVLDAAGPLAWGEVTLHWTPRPAH